MQVLIFCKTQLVNLQNFFLRQFPYDKNYSLYCLYHLYPEMEQGFVLKYPEHVLFVCVHSSVLFYPFSHKKLEKCWYTEWVQSVTNCLLETGAVRGQGGSRSYARRETRRTLYTRYVSWLLTVVQQYNTGGRAMCALYNIRTYNMTVLYT